MKKIILLFVAIIGMTAMAEAQNVYIAPSNSAIAYHKSKDCSYLRNSVNVTAISTTKAKEMGRHACVRCYPELKAKTMKDIENEKKTKKTATAAKKTTTTKKEANTAKKALPERDEKGRFVKKTDTEKKAASTTKKTTTTAKKSLPERDEKGRFIKKSDAEKSTTTKKTTKKAA